MVLMTEANRPTEQVDVVVLGGGPAGATAATLVAQAGYRVRVLEREAFPRFHVGESLMPETYWTFRRLGLVEKLQQSQFTKKYSVQFVNENGRESAPFYFFENNNFEGAQTWQVVRSEFDRMLLDNARVHGADVRIGTRVMDVLFDGDRALGVVVQEPDGSIKEIRATVTIDATGQSALIANRLGIRHVDKKLKKSSIWTYYKGAARQEGIDAGATLVCRLENKRGWFWYIPLHDDITSIGVVSDLDYLFASGRRDHEQIFLEELAKCPGVRDRVASATRVDTFHTTKDFSYRSERVSGDGWVLVGDAFGFLDPIYSSGVFLALKSGEMAADAVVEALRAGDTSREMLGLWEPTFVEGMNRMKRIVYAFYEGMSFRDLVMKDPSYRKHVVDLLVGDLFKDSVDAVVGPMEELVPALAEMG